MSEPNSKNPAGLRRDYTADELNESEVLPDGIAQFQLWFDEACAAKVAEPNSMTLSTVDGNGQPSGRIVLLKGLDPRGFVFHTNYTSRKSRELDQNPRASLVFFWQGLERQVRIEGSVEKISRPESEAYFRDRPRESQLGAWVSHQSTVIQSREELARRQEKLRQRFAGRDIPTPEFWGGYCLSPTKIEFWQGRTGRLHDRIVYVRDGERWNIHRLAP